VSSTDVPTHGLGRGGWCRSEHRFAAIQAQFELWIASILDNIYSHNEKVPVYDSPVQGRFVALADCFIVA
jgi:hypothetical protein